MGLPSVWKKGKLFKQLELSLDNVLEIPWKILEEEEFMLDYQ